MGGSGGAEREIKSAEPPRNSMTAGARVLRSKEVCDRCGLSRVTIWRLERVGKFPKRRYLTNHLVGWLEAEVEAWILSRVTRVAEGDGRPRKLARGQA